MNQDISRKVNIYMFMVFVFWTALYVFNIVKGYQKDSFLLLYGTIAALMLSLIVFVLWHSVLTKGWRRSAVIFTTAVLVPFFAEALGVNYGLWFGPYDYTDMLGPKLLGVPIVIVLAWEPILYSSFYITEILVTSADVADAPLIRRLGYFAGTSLIASIVVTSWDMMMDPIAVNQGWWLWENGGPYVSRIGGGVPLSNYIGWMGVAFICTFVHRSVAGKPPKPLATPNVYYGPMLVYAFLFLAAECIAVTMHGLPDVALAGLLGMGGFLVLAAVKLNTFHPRLEIPVLAAKGGTR